MTHFGRRPLLAEHFTLKGLRLTLNGQQAYSLVACIRRYECDILTQVPVPELHETVCPMLSRLHRLTGFLLSVASCVICIAPVSVQAADLPAPAIPGLRYYEPAMETKPRTIQTDVCVYGGTCAGVTACVQAARMGKKAVLLEFGRHIGGLTSGGLSHTDGGSKNVCGGIAREFYDVAGQANFRPSTAEQQFLDMLKEAGVEYHLLCHLDKVEKDGTRIKALVMEDGLRVEAAQFIDATYEGDLLPRAGVSYTYGREANSQYGETYNGIRPLGKGGHNWPAKVDPYIVPGDPSSGLLPRVVAETGVPGEADKTIQAFCFRMRLVKDDDRIAFPKPAVYDEQQYELLARLFETGADPTPGWSIDTNNHHLFKGAYFIDFVGGNYSWPDADWSTREQIFQDHANYQIGVLYFLTHSPRIPEKWRAYFQQFGLPRDEYQRTSGWTHQLYIREGRRMVSDYVMTQHNCQGREVPEDSVGLASYNMDSHHCQMGVLDGAVENEGNVEIGVNPYPLSYRAITPKASECTNLLVPVALSSTHIAFGSIRMEPVFMILGQSAATAACQAMDAKVDVQAVDYAKLRERLLADKQILTYEGPLRRTGNTIDPETLKGLVRDNEQAETTGAWVSGAVVSPRVGDTYLHDDNQAKGELSARFTFAVPKPGRYEVRISWPANPNRATNVPVSIAHANGTTELKVDQKVQPKLDGAFHTLGTFTFDQQAVVTISNAGTNGYVIVDAVQLLPVDK